MNERNYTLANPTRHIKAGEARRVAARALSPVSRLSSGENAVKALCSHELFMQNVKMNHYVCKENNGFLLCPAKHSANGMCCWKIVAGVCRRRRRRSRLLIPAKNNQTYTDTHVFKKRSVCTGAVFLPRCRERDQASVEWFCIIAEEPNISHFVRLKRLWSEVAARACLRFNISDGVTVAAAVSISVNGEVLPRVCAERPSGAGGCRFKTAAQDQSRPRSSAPPPNAAPANKVWAKCEGGVGENERRVDSLGVGCLCVFCASLGSLHR